MTKKKWALLILCILLLLGYFKFFYKTYSETAIAKSADCIIALDVKRVTNTVIWDILTNPGQWKKVSFSSSGEIDWKDMVKLPDYVFVFHSKAHPANAWYTVFDIKDKADFAKGLAHYHFEKRETPGKFVEYVSKDVGVEILLYGNKLLLGNSAVEDKSYIRQVADELFIQKQYSSKETILKNIYAKSHLAIQLLKNDTLDEDAIIKANFDKTSIMIDAIFTTKEHYSFTETDFSYAPNSLFALGFSQPPAGLYGSINDSTKAAISKAVNFNIDSVLVKSNAYYNLDITAIQPRVDSAISYTYDDNFNPIEKVVVNNVLEPSYNFIIKGDSISNIYNYWNNNGKLERTVAGDLFVPVPFVKSYCSKKNEKELIVASADFKPQTPAETVHCILFLDMVAEKIPASLLKYLPVNVSKAIANIGSCKLVARNEKEKIVLRGNIYKKQNAQQLINW